MQSLLIRAFRLGIGPKKVELKAAGILATFRTEAACLQAADASKVAAAQTDPEAEKKENSDKKKKGSADQKSVDISRLDIRIGKILRAKKHPNADSLYVEEIEIDKRQKRTAVSGLAKHMTLEALKSKPVVLVCNVRPAKMRGVNSEVMVLCAHSEEKVELLVPPPGSVPGDKVECSGFASDPDKELKKKVLDAVMADLKIDGELRAVYKDSPLEVSGGKGVIKVQSLCNVGVK